MEIPPGETVSYAQLSHSLGHPKAARAVARACASNRLAVLVPCHRVIRGSGDLAGYKWGIERKQKLLKTKPGTNDVKNMVWKSRRDESLTITRHLLGKSKHFWETGWMIRLLFLDH